MGNDTEALKIRLENEYKYHKKKATFDFKMAQFLATVAIVAGAVAAILAAFDGVSKLLQIILTGIPPIIVALQARFPFTDRAEWHTQKEIALDVLLRKLQHQGKSVVEVDEELTRLESGYPGRHPLAPDLRKRIL